MNTTQRSNVQQSVRYVLLGFMFIFGFAVFGSNAFAASGIPLYVGHNLTSFPWAVQLQAIGSVSSGGAPASIAIYYLNSLKNVTQIYPNKSATFSVDGYQLNLNLISTSIGSYRYQNNAQITLYSSLPGATSVGHVATSAPYPWIVNLQSLGSANANGQYPATIGIYYGNTLTNVTSIYPGQVAPFTVNSSTIYLEVNSTSAGVYPYQDSAQMQVWYPSFLAYSSTTIQSITTVPTTVSTTTIPRSTTTILPTQNLLNAMNVSLGQNITSGHWTIQLQNVGLDGIFSIYYNKQLANVTAFPAGYSSQISVNGTILHINLDQLNNGLYAYQNWADITPWYLPLTTLTVTSNGAMAGPWTVQLQDLGQGNPAPASLGIYYNGVLTNVTSLNPGNIAEFSYNGNILYVNLNSTSPGLYVYQKTAQIQLWYTSHISAAPTTTTSIFTTTTTVTTTTPTTTILQSGGWMIHISKGWNIIPTFGVNLVDLSSCEANPSTLPKSLFVYDQPADTYINPTYLLTNIVSGPVTYPSNILIASYNTQTGSYAANPSVDNYTGWFYSQQNCVARYPSFNYSSGSLLESSPPTQLTSGWNFITIMPWMLNQSYSHIFSECNVMDVYGWSNNQWQGGENSVSAYLGTRSATTAQMGSSFIVKTGSACQLQISTSSLPSLPP